MLAKNKLNQENIWKVIRQIRKSFLSFDFNPSCDIGNPLLFHNNHIKKNIKTVGEKLKVNTTYSRNKKVSDKILQTAANMVTYLIFCPTAKARTLTIFLFDLFNFKSANNILLAMTSMMKSSKNAGQESSTRIFMKAMEIFKLGTFRDIDVITKDRKIKNFKYYNRKINILGQ